MVFPNKTTTKEDSVRSSFSTDLGPVVSPKFPKGCVMKPACFAFLLLFIAATLFSQSTPVSLINQHTKVVPPVGASQADPKEQARILDSYGKLPLSFEASQGQTDARVKFLSRGAGYKLFLTSDEAVFTLRGGGAKADPPAVRGQLHPKADAPATTAVLRMKLLNANRAAKVTGVDELAGSSNYFIGNDPKKWRTNVPEYAKVKYEGIYSGIDLVYYGNQRQLEYDFVVAPGADPHRIQFDVRGAKSISRDKDGDLVLQMAEGEVRWHKPVVYQQKNGVRREINGCYIIKHGRRVGFEVGGYDSKVAAGISEETVAAERSGLVLPRSSQYRRSTCSETGRAGYCRCAASGQIFQSP